MRHKEDNTNTGVHNTLSTGTIVKGDITTETDFRLDGQVVGNINCKGKIVIGSKGNVTGDITCVNAEISGHVKGSVRINGKLILKSTAEVTGDIFTQTLEIEQNARFNGACTMSTEKGIK